MENERMLLELNQINSATFIIHLSTRLLKQGDPGHFMVVNLEQTITPTNPLTLEGERLARALAPMEGISVLYGAYSIMVTVRPIFDVKDVIWDVATETGIALRKDVSFAISLGDDAYDTPEFIYEPIREEFDYLIDAALTELRRRNSQAIAEAERTIERLSALLEQSRRPNPRQ